MTVKKNINILAIDFQNDFCTSCIDHDPDNPPSDYKANQINHDFFAGKWYLERPSHRFILGTLVPFCKKHNLKIAQIISDYRLPRPNEFQAYCIPGHEGFQSALPDDVTHSNVWIKAMNSPDWTRVNAGIAESKPGIPYQDPKGFTNWLKEAIGDPPPPPTSDESRYTDDSDLVVLIGLTLDCCVLATAMQLYQRGYRVRILTEAVDAYDPKVTAQYLELFKQYPMFSSPITWSELKPMLQKSVKQEEGVNPTQNSKPLFHSRL